MPTPRTKGFSPDSGGYRQAAALTAETGRIVGAARAQDGATIGAAFTGIAEKRERDGVRADAKAEREGERAAQQERWQAEIGMRKDEATFRHGEAALELLGRVDAEAQRPLLELQARVQSREVDPNDPKVVEYAAELTRKAQATRAAMDGKAREVLGVGLAGEVSDPLRALAAREIQSRMADSPASGEPVDLDGLQRQLADATANAETTKGHQKAQWDARAIRLTTEVALAREKQTLAKKSGEAFQAKQARRQAAQQILDAAEQQGVDPALADIAAKSVLVGTGDLGADYQGAAQAMLAEHARRGKQPPAPKAGPVQRGDDAAVQEDAKRARAGVPSLKQESDARIKSQRESKDNARYSAIREESQRLGKVLDDAGPRATSDTVAGYSVEAMQELAKTVTEPRRKYLEKMIAERGAATTGGAAPSGATPQPSLGGAPTVIRLERGPDGKPRRVK